MYTLVSLYVNPPFTCIPSSQSPLNLQIYLPPICLSVSCFFFFLLLPIFVNLYIRFVRQSAYPFFCLPICVSLLYRRSANVRFPPIRMCVCPPPPLVGVSVNPSFYFSFSFHVIVCQFVRVSIEAVPFSLFFCHIILSFFFPANDTERRRRKRR